MNMPGEKKQNYSKAYGTVLSIFKMAIFGLAVLLLIFVVIFLARSVYYLGYESTSYEAIDSASDAVEITITITGNMTASDIGELLIEEGVIDESIGAFLIQDRLSGLHDSYIPGTYTLNTSLTVDEILQLICTEQEEE